MSGDVLHLTGRQADEYFAEQRARLVQHRRGHEWYKTKRNPWLVYCDECGLVWSNNRTTQKAIKAGCTFYRLKERA